MRLQACHNKLKTKRQRVAEKGYGLFSCTLPTLLYKEYWFLVNLQEDLHRMWDVNARKGNFGHIHFMNGTF